MIKSFLDLDVYQESFQLSLEIDALIKTFPKEEQYLLSDQWGLIGSLGTVLRLVVATV